MSDLSITGYATLSQVLNNNNQMTLTMFTRIRASVHLELLSIVTVYKQTKVVSGLWFWHFDIINKLLIIKYIC